MTRFLIGLLCEMCLACAAWQAAQTPAVAASPSVDGDARMVDLIRDALTTSQANLRRGRVLFEASETSAWEDVFVKGELTWDQEREHFLGTIHRIERFPGDRPQKDHGVREVEAIKTATAFCRHDQTQKSYVRTLQPPPKTSFDLRMRPDEFGLYLLPTKAKLLAERLVIDETSTTFVIRALGKEMFSIDRDLQPSGTRLRFLADWSQGGHIVEYSSTKPSRRNQTRSTAAWRQHASGTWYPATVQVLSSDDDPDRPTYKYTHTIHEFSPAPQLPANWYDPRSLRLPVGTATAVETAQGMQYGMVGSGPRDHRAEYDQRLREAAEQLRRSGFAAPKAGGQTSP